MTARPWGDHQEHRLTLTRITGCDGAPIYEGGTDQCQFCAGGCISFNDGDFHLPVAKLAEFVTTLYETAGKPGPVILDRPEIDRESIRGVAGWRLLLSGERDRDGRQFIAAGYGVHPCADLSPSEAREVAATLAAYADLSEADGVPDPAEVEELARALHENRERNDGEPGEWDRQNARTALRWMRDKQQREGGRL